MAEYYPLGVLNLLFLLVGVVVLSIVNLYGLIKWQHPQDKNQWWAAKIVVLGGMLVTELVIIGLPLDVSNNGGARECSYDFGDTAECGGLDMRGYWTATFGLAMAWVLVMVPTLVSAYEAHDETGDATCAFTARAAACSELGLLVVFFLVLLPMYFILGVAKLPVEEYRGTIAGAAVRSYAAVEGATSFDAMGDLAADDAVFAGSTNVQLSFGVDFLTYASAFFSWIGWFLFALWGGIGLACLPIDLVLAYVYRPVPMDARELAELKLAIQRRTGELLDVGESLRRERSAFKDGDAKGWWATRKHKAADQIRVNKFAQMVMILEGDVEELEICSGRATDYEPLVYVGYLFAGVAAGLASLAWLAHIVLYMLLPDPPTPFLNAFLGQFNGWYPLAGSLACAFLSFYLLLATMKGCLKFGTRFFLVKLHPMKYNGTELNAFLFNVGLFALCAFPVVQFCAAAFAEYGQYADAATRFKVIKHLVFFRAFYETSAFEYALVAVLGASLIWLFVAPHDVPASSAKLKASLSRKQDTASLRGGGGGGGGGKKKARGYAPHTAL